MNKLTLKLAIAISTFGLGAALATLWIVQHRSPPTPAMAGAPSVVQIDPQPARGPDTDQGEVAVTAGPEARATSIEKEWRGLVTATFCFNGLQYYSPELELRASQGAEIEPGGGFSPRGRLPSIKRDEAAAVEFLINQIPDKRKTRAHVCPLDNATRGELAIYCLQHILKKNWPELSEDYSRLFDRKAEGVTSQHLLRGAIRNVKGAQKMMSLWREYYKSVKEA